MKMICIGRNYAQHARELGNAVPSEPIFFLKPSTALLPPGSAFRIPEWSKEIHYEMELVYRIGKRCSAIRADEAAHHLDGVTVGLDLTARDVQEQLKSSGAPWEKAKAFDGSAVVSDRSLPVTDLDAELSFGLERNGKIVQQGRSTEMLFPVPLILEHVSRFITLEPGDLVFTGTPAGVGPLSPGDLLEGTLEGRSMFQLRVEG